MHSPLPPPTSPIQLSLMCEAILVIPTLRHPSFPSSRLTASEWVLHSLSALKAHGNAEPKGNPIKEKLSEHLLYFGWVENIDQPEECLEICAKSSRDLAAQRLS